jgi:CRP-like cAMP-binding protein
MVSFQRRVLENISLPAAERYKNFAKRYPVMVQRLPQTQVASYLGITPEFLSKIRHQMMYQKP